MYLVGVIANKKKDAAYNTSFFFHDAVRETKYKYKIAYICHKFNIYLHKNERKITMQRFETKYDILQRAYKDRDIKKGTISLLQYLVMKSNKSNCFPAVDTIAAALGCCRRTVQYNMRKLERAGYIVRKDRWYNHQQLSNQYCFPLDVMEDVPGPEKYTETEYNIMNAFSFTNQQDASGKAAWINKIYQCHNLSKCAKQIMVYLLYRANKKGLAYDAIRDIRDALGMCERTIIKMLHRLREVGLIKFTRRIARSRYVMLCLINYDGIDMLDHTVKRENPVRSVETKKISQDETKREGSFTSNMHIHHYLFGTLRKIKKHLDLILDTGRRRIIWVARWSCSWNLKRRISNFTGRVGRIIHEILRI